MTLGLIEELKSSYENIYSVPFHNNQTIQEAQSKNNCQNIVNLKTNKPLSIAKTLKKHVSNNSLNLADNLAIFINNNTSANASHHKRKKYSNNLIASNSSSNKHTKTNQISGKLSNYRVVTNNSINENSKLTPFQSQNSNLQIIKSSTKSLKNLKGIQNNISTSHNNNLFKLNFNNINNHENINTLSSSSQINTKEKESLTKQYLLDQFQPETIINKLSGRSFALKLNSNNSIINENNNFHINIQPFEEEDSKIFNNKLHIASNKSQAQIPNERNKSTSILKVIKPKNSITINKQNNENLYYKSKPNNCNFQANNNILNQLNTKIGNNENLTTIGSSITNMNTTTEKIRSSMKLSDKLKMFKEKFNSFYIKNNKSIDLLNDLVKQQKVLQTTSNNKPKDSKMVCKRI